MGTARLDDTLTCVAFLALLAVPAVATFTGEHRALSPSENRTLAAAPEWGWSPPALSAFPRAFEAWMDDHFALRPALLPLYQRLRFDAFGISPTDEVLVGQDGYLYLTEGTTQFEPLDEAQLAKWVEELERRADALARKGIAYLLVVVPDKTDVYPEFLPPEWRRRKERASRIERFCEALAARTRVPILDLNPVLRAAKEREELYYRNDPHWNSYGAYVGYGALLERVRPLLAERLPALQVVPWEDFGIPKWRFAGGGLARMMGLERHLYETSYKPRGATPGSCAVPFEIYPPPEPSTGSDCAGKPGRVLVFHDSYMTALKPFLSETFGHVAYLWMRPSYPRFRQWVEREQPDLVIEERVSRFLAEDWRD